MKREIIICVLKRGKHKTWRARREDEERFIICVLRRDMQDITCLVTKDESARTGWLESGRHVLGENVYQVFACEVCFWYYRWGNIGVYKMKE